MSDEQLKRGASVNILLNIAGHHCEFVEIGEQARHRLTTINGRERGSTKSSQVVHGIPAALTADPVSWGLTSFSTSPKPVESHTMCIQEGAIFSHRHLSLNDDEWRELRDLAS